jgi:hypothetical protein
MDATPQILDPFAAAAIEMAEEKDQANAKARTTVDPKMLGWGGMTDQSGRDLR